MSVLLEIIGEEACSLSMGFLEWRVITADSVWVLVDTIILALRKCGPQATRCGMEIWSPRKVSGVLIKSCKFENAIGIG